jgi:hypothetical protein
MISIAAVERDIVIVVCAVSAGIHAALVRDHFVEGVGAGTGFLTAAVVLTIVVFLLTRRAPTTVLLGAVSVILVGLLASYGLAVTTGVPWLHPHPEATDRLALATKAIEAVGLVAALHLTRCGRVTVTARVFQTKGVRP